MPVTGRSSTGHGYDFRTPIGKGLDISQQRDIAEDSCNNIYKGASNARKRFVRLPVEPLLISVTLSWLFRIVRLTKEL